jgi:hypothetical protein
MVSLLIGANYGESIHRNDRRAVLSAKPVTISVATNARRTPPVASGVDP